MLTLVMVAQSHGICLLVWRTMKLMNCPVKKKNRIEALDLTSISQEAQRLEKQDEQFQEETTGLMQKVGLCNLVSQKKEPVSD